MAAARRECAAAEALFQMVADPDLVDHAIHRLAAAERRLVYLLRLARAEHLRVEPPGAGPGARPLLSETPPA